MIFASGLEVTADVLCRMAGLLGFATYIAGFAALQLRKICGNGAAYSVINIVAAGLVLISLSVDFNLASALIQTSWIAIGTLGLVMHRKVARRFP